MEEDCSACGWGELYLTRLHDGLTPTVTCTVTCARVG